jgi:hypothetical protein
VEVWIKEEFGQRVRVEMPGSPPEIVSIEEGPKIAPTAETIKNVLDAKYGPGVFGEVRIPGPVIEGKVIDIHAKMEVEGLPHEFYDGVRETVREATGTPINMLFANV